MHVRKNEAGPLSFAARKMSLKWIKSLNLTRETLKLAEENRGSVLALVLVMIFLHLTPEGKAAAGKVGGAALSDAWGAAWRVRAAGRPRLTRAPDPGTGS